MSRALMDSDISHDEFVSVKELKEFNDIKAIKNPRLLIHNI